MDEHVPQAVSQGLQRRGVDVLTTDFLRLHAAGFSHQGIAYASQQTPVSDIVRGLMLIFDLLSPEEMVNHVEFL